MFPEQFAQILRLGAAMPGSGGKKPWRSTVESVMRLSIAMVSCGGRFTLEAFAAWAVGLHAAYSSGGLASGGYPPNCRHVTVVSSVTDRLYPHTPDPVALGWKQNYLSPFSLLPFLFPPHTLV